MQMTDFLSETMENKGNATAFFEGWKKKELLTENSASSENILDENHSVLR